MRRSGTADLPLHGGHVPPWLAQRMAKLGLAITEAIIMHKGKSEFLSRMSDPFWFQSFGAVMGMDWHSSGITTSVMGALKKSINPISKQLGIHICGGKGKHSKNTPDELLKIGDKTGLNADSLIRSSKLTAKVDNTAVQDGFQLYLHSFIVSDEGEWAVVQQGMKEKTAMARRYHWHSAKVRSFVEEPHTGICGQNQGLILNLTAQEAQSTRNSIQGLLQESPNQLLSEIRHLDMPAHHEVRQENVDLKRLGSMLWLAHDAKPSDFEEILLLPGMGPRTLQSLTLVSEVIHGTPSRFKDPARFSFAHGGKDGHPFPVPVKVYDETIELLNDALQHAKIGQQERTEAIRALHSISREKEKFFTPNENFEDLIEKERIESWKYGGKTVFGDATPPAKGLQLRMF
ncbi:MAG TPA: DUF763 domain-containing protein [Flavitalea sp.]|nr:DUF763 domain-containing protein [Flavitalea sp.]